MVCHLARVELWGASRKAGHCHFGPSASTSGKNPTLCFRGPGMKRLLPMSVGMGALRVAD